MMWKAVEYYIDDQLEKAADVLGHDTQLTGLKTLVHFACTSEDINNLSIARCVKNGVEQVLAARSPAIVDHLAQKADAYRQGHAVADPWTARYRRPRWARNWLFMCIVFEPSAQQGQGPGISR